MIFAICFFHSTLCWYSNQWSIHFQSWERGRHAQVWAGASCFWAASLLTERCHAVLAAHHPQHYSILQEFMCKLHHSYVLHNWRFVFFQVFCGGPRKVLWTVVAITISVFNAIKISFPQNCGNDHCGSQNFWDKTQLFFFLMKKCKLERKTAKNTTLRRIYDQFIKTLA